MRKLIRVGSFFVGGNSLRLVNFLLSLFEESFRDSQPINNGLNMIKSKDGLVFFRLLFGFFFIFNQSIVISFNEIVLDFGLLLALVLLFVLFLFAFFLFRDDSNKLIFVISLLYDNSAAKLLVVVLTLFRNLCSSFQGEKLP